MNTKTLLASLTLALAAGAHADDSADALLADWRNANTNAYRAVMERRLAADPGDIAGLTLKYFWQRVFSWQTPSERASFIGTTSNLLAAVNAYRGPSFSKCKSGFAFDVEHDLADQIANAWSAEDNAAYRDDIARWGCWSYLTMYKRVFRALEADGAFKTPPTAWTGDPSLLGLGEAATNCFCVVTNIWPSGAITNVARIARNRLSSDPNDLPGRLMLVDCAFVYGDFENVTNRLPGLMADLSAQTNAPGVRALRQETDESLGGMLRLSMHLLQHTDKSERTALPLPTGMPYPHEELLKALLEAEGARP